MTVSPKVLIEIHGSESNQPLEHLEGKAQRKDRGAGQDRFFISKTKVPLQQKLERGGSLILHGA
jgi:hypothetical protein